MDELLLELLHERLPGSDSSVSCVCSNPSCFCCNAAKSFSLSVNLGFKEGAGMDAMDELYDDELLDAAQGRLPRSPSCFLLAMSSSSVIVGLMVSSFPAGSELGDTSSKEADALEMRERARTVVVQKNFMSLRIDRVHGW